MNSQLAAMDLFAGAGGLSLGFKQAGFSIPYAIEKDAWAAETYKKNHHDTEVFCSDITEMSDSFFHQFSGIDAVIGGPPCQGFSIAASNRRKPNDPRNYLYKHFLRVVEITKPKIVLIENVKEILNYSLPEGKKLIDDICESLTKLKYNVDFGLLNAASYNIPQNRIRFFFIASLKSIPVFLKLQSNNINAEQINSLTLWDAISDLPEVKPGVLSEDEIQYYNFEPLNDYQRILRNGSDCIYNHIPMRHTERCIERFKLININESTIDVPEHHKPRERGNPDTISNSTYYQNHRRLNPEKLSPTITASFYSSFLHPYQHRNLTVREAARIQSFPDTYRFFGKRTTLSKKLLLKKGIYEDLHLDQFNQVGNSVPPLLAKFLAEYILKIHK